MSINPPHSVLYYPTIEFIDESWVKRALLFWDHVYRIVPTGYKPNDSDELRELYDNGLIINVNVSEAEKVVTLEKFIKFFKNLEYKPAGLNIQQVDRLNSDKIDSRLYPLLDHISDKIIENGEDEWFYLDSKIARGYMFFLSQAIAESRRLVRATDNIDIWSIAPYFTEKGNFPFEDVIFNENNKGLYCSLMLEDVLPQNVGDITAKQIIDFNRKRHSERCQFRDKISELTDVLPQITSREQWEDEINFKLEEIERDKDEFRKSQTFWKSDMPSSIFSVGLPLSLTALGLDEYSTINLTKSIILGGIATILDYRKCKKNRNPSYSSYLVGIDNIATRSVSAYAANSMQEFIDD